MEDEDEQLRRAIELSMQSSAPSTAHLREDTLEEDEELARAIQLSLEGKCTTGPVHRSSSLPAARTADDVCAQGRLFVLNEIKGLRGADANSGCISIRKLVRPESLVAALVTSFTEDVEWVLSVIPPTIPITLVRHWEEPDREGEVRISRNIRVIHPPLALPGFGGGQAMRAKMHAKLMLLRYRDNTLRVVVTSANLAQPDYELVGQTVWYQDFPKKQQKSSGQQPASPFEETLTQFLVALKADEGFLREYDFSKAAADLVVSVPGFHRGKHKMDAVGHTRLRALLRDFQWPPADELRDDNIYYQTSSLGALYESFVSEFKESASSGVFASSSSARTTTTTTTTIATSSTTTSASRSSAPAKRKRDESEPAWPMSASGRSTNKRPRTAEADTASHRKGKKKENESEHDGDEGDFVEEKGTKSKNKASSSATRGKKGVAAPATATSATTARRPELSLAILYPSMDAVRSARPEYRVGAGYLFLQEKHWSAKSFPRALFHDIWPSSHRPARHGILLHSKVVCRLATHRSGRRYGWVYAGSHNLSAAAWGRLQKGGTQLFISNFEIGVVLKHPYQGAQAGDEGADDDDDDVVVVLPAGPEWERNLPFMVPPPAYTDDSEPFIGDKYFSGAGH